MAEDKAGAYVARRSYTDVHFDGDLDVKVSHAPRYGASAGRSSIHRSSRERSEEDGDTLKARNKRVVRSVTPRLLS